MNDETIITDIDEAALFPIGTISEQTGVNTVTLRAWERRYGLLKPHRTPKGHRLYSPQDVQRVKQVLVLLEQGIPVSRVRDVLDSKTLHPALLAPVTETKTDDPWEQYWQQFQRWIRKLDARSLDHRFNEAVSLYSLELVAKKLILPLYHYYQQQSQALPSTCADYAFLHEFLCAKLGSRYLQHNTRATGKRILLFNTQSDYTMRIETLMLAKILAQSGYQVSLLGELATLDSLPLLTTRTDLDALLLVGNNLQMDKLDILVNFCHLQTFVYGMGIPEQIPENAVLHFLTNDYSAILQTLGSVLETDG